MLFIKTCPPCRRKNFQPKKLPGAKKPMISKNFRDRFQVDLIDMRSDAQMDIYGNLMKWICSVRVRTITQVLLLHEQSQGRGQKPQPLGTCPGEMTH
eukprot:scaffold50232_cov23-Cyclotella_meneghiniana.AAC.1